MITCKHRPEHRATSPMGEIYCGNCGAILGYADRSRPCGCPADPGVFGR